MQGGWIFCLLNKRVRILLFSVVSLIIYYLSARLGLAFAFRHEQVSAVWPPTGIAISILLLLGLRFSPLIFLGAFLYNYLHPTHQILFTSLGIGFGNMLEAFVGAYAIRKLIGKNDVLFISLKNVLLFFGISIFIAPSFSATIGVLSLTLSGIAKSGDFFIHWVTWLIGDGMGALIFIPFILNISKLRLHIMTLKGFIEMFLVLILITILIEIRFGLFSVFTDSAPILYTCFVPVLWAAFRFTTPGVSLAILVSSSLAVFSTTGGLGPFANFRTQTSLIYLQIFNGVLAFTGLIVAALVEEKKRFLVSLNEERIKFQDLFDNAPDMYFTFDPKTKTINQCNEALVIFFESQKKDLIGSSFFNLYDPNYKDEAIKVFNQFLPLRKTKDSILYLKKKSGECVPINQSLSALISPLGDITLCRAIWTDISGHAEIENKLRQINIDLKNFSSKVSHELKSPLRITANYLQLIETKLKSKLDFEDQGRVKTCLNSIAEMTSLIDQLLEYSKIGWSTIEKEWVSSKAILDKAIKSVKHTLQKSDDVKVLISSDMPMIFANPDLLEALFINLLSNSIKFKQPNLKPQITVSTFEDRGSWQFKVADNGIGIPSEYQEKIFNIFERGVRDSSIPGSGIGLATCKRIIEAHQGSIWIEKNRQKGSCFFFSIPIPKKKLIQKKPNVE